MFYHKNDALSTLAITIANMTSRDVVCMSTSISIVDAIIIDIITDIIIIIITHNKVITILLHAALRDGGCPYA